MQPLLEQPGYYCVDCKQLAHFCNLTGQWVCECYDEPTEGYVHFWSEEVGGRFPDCWRDIVILAYEVEE